MAGIGSYRIAIKIGKSADDGLLLFLRSGQFRFELTDGFKRKSGISRNPFDCEIIRKHISRIIVTRREK